MSEIKLFNRWSMEGIAVSDPGLKAYICLKPFIVPRTFGRNSKQQFYKSQYQNIVERLMTHLFVPGHRGKRHRLSSGVASGKTITVWKVTTKAFEIIEKKTGKNPIEVFVKALENAALKEEITSFQVGGIIVRRAVIVSPQRRIDLALKLIVQGAYQKSFGKEKRMHEALADEIMACFNNDAQNSHAIREKDRRL